jgi:ankyrin repeat protein
MVANRFGDTPLIAAIRSNNIEQLASALDNGANVEEPDIHGFSGLPLRTACFAGNVPVILLLLQHGANINAVTADGPGAPLKLALRGGHDEVAALLLAHHADVPADLKISPALLERAQEISSTRTNESLTSPQASPATTQDTKNSADYWEKYTAEKSLSNSFKRHSNAWEQVSPVDDSKPALTLVDIDK